MQQKSVLICFVPDFAQAQTWRLLLTLDRLWTTMPLSSVPVLVVGDGRRLAPATHLIQTLRLPFTLLADDGRAVAARYGVPVDTFACFLLDRAGQVVYAQQFPSVATLRIHDLHAAAERLAPPRGRSRTTPSAWQQAVQMAHA
ncbi:MAG: hypothetical protein IAE79_11295 [Anaerolinea sp.]|nr:hypothetical protein [Anaerolinea sp.]